jgi:hypothetical protein
MLGAAAPDRSAGGPVLPWAWCGHTPAATIRLHGNGSMEGRWRLRGIERGRRFTRRYAFGAPASPAPRGNYRTQGAYSLAALHTRKAPPARAPTARAVP